MRQLLLTLALARTQHALPPRMGMLNRVLMQAGLADPIEHFEGRFYGVSAKVALNMRTRVARCRSTACRWAGASRARGGCERRGRGRHRRAGARVSSAACAAAWSSIYRARLDRASTPSPWASRYPCWA